MHHEKITSERAFLACSVFLPHVPEGVKPAFRVALYPSDTQVDAKTLLNATQSGTLLCVRNPSQPEEFLLHWRGVPKPENVDITHKLSLAWQYRFANAAGETEVRSGLLESPARIEFQTRATDVVLLIDGSLSMLNNDPRRIRETAARMFIELGRLSGGIGRVAVVQFNNRVQTLLPLTEIHRTAAFGPAFQRLVNSGQTDIQGALEEGVRLLTSANPNRLGDPGVIVMLSDGKQEGGRYTNGHNLAKEAGIPVHSLALGKTADRAFLKMIADETGGTFLETNRDQDLLRLYATIAGRFSDGETILSRIVRNDERIRFPIDGSCSWLGASIENASGLLTLIEPGASVPTLRAPLEDKPSISAASPRCGMWQAEWSSKSTQGDYWIKVNAKTPLLARFFQSISPTSSNGAKTVSIDPDWPEFYLSVGEQAWVDSKAQLQIRFLDRNAQEMSISPAEITTSGNGIFRIVLSLQDFQHLPISSSGTLEAILEGQRPDANPDGQAYRRQLSTDWTLRRSGKRKIELSDRLDLGMAFPGERVQASLNYRLIGKEAIGFIRNDKGRLQLQGPESLSFNRTMQQTHYTLDVPPELEPGTYQGTLTCMLPALESSSDLDRGSPELTRQIPWQLEVQTQRLIASPAMIELGQLTPGQKGSFEFQLVSNGGGLGIQFSAQRSVEPTAVPLLFDLARFPMLDRSRFVFSGMNVPQRVGTQPEKALFEFQIPEHALAGSFQREILFYTDRADLAPTRATIKGTVKPISLKINVNLNLGDLEPGDTVTRTIELEREYGDAGNASFERAAPLITLLSDQENATHELKQSKELPPQIIWNALKPGVLNGFIKIESEQALALLPWRGRTINPELVIDNRVIDFGELYAGSQKNVVITLELKGTKPSEFFTVLNGPLHKPLKPEITLDAALTLSHTTGKLEPAQLVQIEARLKVPNEAQLGRYISSCSLTTRLGDIAIPIQVLVKSLIPTPAFTVSPAELILEVTPHNPYPLGNVKVNSHVDDSLRLNCFLVPKEINKDLPVLMVSSLEHLTDAQPLDLTGFSEGQLVVRAKPNANNAERCTLIIEGAGERQQVSITIVNNEDYERTQVPVSGRDSFYDWLALLFLLLLILLILLINALIKRKWVRYVTYAVALHAVLMFMVVEPGELIESLPPAIKITLVNAQQELGFVVSPEQQRRLDAIKPELASVEQARPAELLATRSVSVDTAQVSLPEQAEAHSASQVKLESLAVQEQPPQPNAKLTRNTHQTREEDEPIALAEALTARSEPQQETAPMQTQREVKITQPTSKHELMENKITATYSYNEASTTQVELVAQVIRPMPDQAREPQLQELLARRSNALIDPEDQPLEIEAKKVQTQVTKPELKTPEANPLTETITAVLQPMAIELPKVEIVESGSTPAPSPQPITTTTLSPAPSLQENRPQASSSTSKDSNAKGLRRSSVLVSDASDEPLGSTALASSNAAAHASAEHMPSNANVNLASATALTASNRQTGSEPASLTESLIKNLQSGGPKTQTLEGPGGSGRSALNSPATNLTQLNANSQEREGLSIGERGRAGSADPFGKNIDQDTPLKAGSGDARLTQAHMEPTRSEVGLSRGAAPHKQPTSTFSGSSGTLAERQALAKLGTLDGAGLTDGRAGASFRSAINEAGLGTVTLAERFSGQAGGSSAEATRRTSGLTAQPLEGDRLGEAGLLTERTGSDKPAADSGERLAVRAPHATASLQRLNGSGFGQAAFTGLESSDLTTAQQVAKPGHVQAAMSAVQFKEVGAGRDEPLRKSLLRPSWGEVPGDKLHLRLGLVRHSGDWDSSPTALYNLAAAFRERSGLPEIKVEILKLELQALSERNDCQLLLITSNDPVSFSPHEIAALRAYVQRGGLVWFNDSSASGDKRFDEALQRDLPALFPQQSLLPLEMQHPLFSSAYDLRAGYKGFRIPPGDKYREEFVRGISFGTQHGVRTAVIYTRNDYADGLEIDPREIAGRPSLTDLTPDEMLEGSLRFGINLLAYALGSKAPRFPPPPERPALFEKLYRYSGPPLPVADALNALATTEDATKGWQVEPWGNAGTLKFEGQGEQAQLKLEFKEGREFKVALGRSVEWDLAKSKALVLDLHSGVTQGLNVALLLQCADFGYESRPVYVRPGWNRNLRFPLDLDDFKSSKNQWKTYTVPFMPRERVTKIMILIYNQNLAGTIHLHNLRIER